MFDFENLEKVIWLILIVLRRLRHFLFIQTESIYANLIVNSQLKCIAVQKNELHSYNVIESTHKRCE